MVGVRVVERGWSGMRRVGLVFVAVGLAMSIVVVASADAAPPPRVTIQRDAVGVPDITAGSYRDLGAGLGYAYAQDNVCTLANELVTVRARRSLVFGPDARTIASARVSDRNIDSDLFWQQIIDRHVVERILARRPPRGPSRAARRLMAGYAAGYNRYLRSVGGPDGIRDPRCRGQAWVRPATPVELWRRAYQISLLASGAQLIRDIVAAQPPPATASAALAGGEAVSDLAAVAAWKRRLPGPKREGSNAIALGSRATANGHGLMIGNPHFPWYGVERFYSFGLHLPGRLNVKGASLHGAPIVHIGFNRHVAWSHTVSTAQRFTPFQLTLVPGDRTAYVVDGQPRRMRAQTVRVPVRSGAARRHTFYYAGDDVVFALPAAGYAWTPENAYALGDVNADNLRWIDAWLDIDRARSVRDIRRAQSRWQGIPWVNTIAADRSGRVLYQDNSAVPNVTAAKIDACVPAGLPRAVYEATGIVTLDGSRSACEWGRDRDAVEPGLFGPSHLPILVRRDFVSNANDSFWLTNPRRPLTGFSPILGFTDTEQSARTRQVNDLIARRLAGRDGLPGRRFTVRNLRRLWQRDVSYGATLVRTQLVALCRADPMVTLPNGTTEDVSAACPVLERWDGRATLDSRGAWLFGAWWQAAAGGDLPAPGFWADAFDPARPLTTPSRLAPSDANRQALATAVRELRARGLPLDVPIRRAQVARRDSKRIPIHGCNSGCWQDIEAVRHPSEESARNGFRVRYGQVTYGSSWVQIVALTRRGPHGSTILTYSQSENPRSRHATDQTRLFSAKQWVPIRLGG
jgi:acyl-homoserine-lactone acylase